jgi:16S rRNA (cytosine1407-C5)-methyltransferase
LSRGGKFLFPLDKGGDGEAEGDLWQNLGFLISNEIDQWRKKALESNLHRCGIFNVWVINQDWCIIWDNFPETFDKVLVDAPCSW